MSILYLSEADIARIELGPNRMREAILSAFTDSYEGRIISQPKIALELQPGHSFQALGALSIGSRYAAIKWIGVARDFGPATANINASILLSDVDSGQLLAVIEANILTGLRTAAMSAAAAGFLARPESGTVGFVGCGTQATSHLEALRRVLPQFKRVWAISRSRKSAEQFAEVARRVGLDAAVADSAEQLVRHSDVVVTSVPMSAHFEPFLDPSWIAEGTFIAAVDIGRSWRRQGLGDLEQIVTDDNEQHRQLVAGIGAACGLPEAHADLEELAVGIKSGRRANKDRIMFISRGVATADLAAARLVYEQALKEGIGKNLHR